MRARLAVVVAWMVAGVHDDDDKDDDDEHSTHGRIGCGVICTTGAMLGV